MPDHIGEFNTQAVSNTIWGCAALDFYNQHLYEAVARELRGAPPRPASRRKPVEGACGLQHAQSGACYVCALCERLTDQEPVSWRPSAQYRAVQKRP